MATHAGMFVPLDTAGNGMSALDGRLALGGLIGTVQRCASGGAITASGSNMQFTVAQSVFELADLDNSGAMMLTPFDTTTLPAIPAGPTSGSRIDSIIVRQQIVGNSLGDTATPGLMQTVQGTPSTGTPTLPTIPAGWYEYARITVPTNASTAAACSTQILYPATLAPATLASASAAAIALVAGTASGQRALGADGIDYRWNGTIWKPWESDWASYSPTVGGLTGSLGANPGWFIGFARFRYVSGKVRYEGNFSLNGGSAAASGQLTVSLPIAASIQTGAARPDGFANGRDANPVSTDYLLPIYLSSGTASFGSLSGSPAAVVPTSSTSPITWGQSDQVSWAFEYSPS